VEPLGAAILVDQEQKRLLELLRKWGDTTPPYQIICCTPETSAVKNFYVFTGGPEHLAEKICVASLIKRRNSSSIAACVLGA
jgi:hypothetical protein